ncbi:MAG: hypothetical protein A2Y17_04995 [Clostridiales bacterium GWF2_38_85]|nr:MAG: hypothetical protein A2Y17_04995 [Clostridiales bacterium GWF2_38_85]HBL84354.1 hypothetical protein [Clostridiales bacterium]
MSYIINKWALVRRSELSVTPEATPIHPDFLHILSREDFEAAFRQIGVMFYQIMTDISEAPERFAMPLYEESETLYGAPEAQESRYAAWRPMKLLYTLFTHGQLNNHGFSVDIPAFKQANKIKNIHLLLRALRDYGLVFSGLTNDKITPKTTDFTIDYPDNPNIIVVMTLVAQKAAGVGADDLFYKWSYRLLSEGFGKNSNSDPFYAVYDKTRTNEEREFIRNFHETMREMGYYHAHGGWNEGPGICYYDKESIMKRKGPYLFRILDWMGDLRLMLRIRNAEKCIDLYTGKDMPSEITKMFRYSDPGCDVHANENCNKGVSYSFEGQSRWHCGCCNAPFWLHPKAENISHYIKLVETGEKRCAK